MTIAVNAVNADKLAVKTKELADTIAELNRLSAAMARSALLLKIVPDAFSKGSCNLRWVRLSGGNSADRKLVRGYIIYGDGTERQLDQKEFDLLVLNGFSD